MTVPAHGGQLRRIAETYGLRPEQILDFSANINPDGPPASVLARLRAALDEPATLTSYPDLELHTLRAALAAHLAVPPAAVSIANGFVPLLAAAVHARGLRRCLLPVPAFSEYRRTLEGCGVAVVPFALEPHGFRYEPERLLAEAYAADADAILLANPQNPTGSLSSRTAMEQLTRSAGAAGITVLLDEAFLDYAPGQSLSALPPTLANLVVFRSLTKFFAIPGLRVAYAISHSQHALQLDRALPPWPVSTLASLAAEAALADHAYQEQTRKRNGRRREELRQALAALRVESLPGAANFLLLRPPCAATVLRERLLKEHGILLRSCENFEGLHGEYLRTAVRNDAENDRLLVALRTILIAPPL